MTRVALDVPAADAETLRRALSDAGLELVAPDERAEYALVTAAVHAAAATEVGRLARVLALRDGLLDLAAHDLRNPLHSLSIALAELDNPELPAPERRQFAGAARRSLEKMERILNDFLDLGHLDSGTLQITPQPVAASWVLDQLVADHQGACEAAGVAISLEAEPELGDVLVDPDRTRQALAKLVQNACRHARGSGPLAVRARRDGEAIEIVMADRGPGFAASQLPDPLDRQPEPGRNRRPRGLGLPLANALIRAMGGVLTAKNRDERGAELTIRLKRA